MTLIAEDVLLLLLHDEKGTSTTSYLRTVLGGAVLAELALDGTVEVEKTSVWSSAKVTPTGTAVLDDDLLAHALAIVAEKPRSPQDLVQRLGKGLDEQLGERLAARGILRRERGRLLGLFPVTRWPTEDVSHEADVRRRLAEVLVQGVEPDARTAVVCALLHGVDKAHKVVDHRGMRASAVRRRAKQIAKGDGEWAAKAVRDAVSASVTAVAAATSAATAGDGGGSS